MMSCFFYSVFLGLLAVQVLTQGNGLPNPTADSSSDLGTTTEAGFFRRIFNAARDMVSPVRHDASTTMSTPIPGPPAASPHAHLQFMQEPPRKGLAQMNFSLRLLNEDLSVAEEPHIYEEDALIYIEARVQTSSAMLFPKIFIDECYGTDTMEQIQPRRRYVIAGNHGCLYSEEPETTWFRKKDSAIVLAVPAFSVTGELAEEIFIHCWLTAWSHKIPTTSGKKACYFNPVSSRWKNIDEPFKTSVCNCCDSFCPMESLHHGNFKASFVDEGRLHREVAGPLTLHKKNIRWLWLAENCHTMRSLILGSFAFLATFAVMILFIGVIVAIVMFMIRGSRSYRKHQPLVNKMEQEWDHDTELKTVAGALAAEALGATERIEESNLDYCKLKGDTPEKA